jgi:hypothetical protein
LHDEGWAHFSEGRKEIAAAFAKASLEDRVRWLHPGRALSIEPIGQGSLTSTWPQVEKLCRPQFSCCSKFDAWLSTGLSLDAAVGTRRLEH